MQVFDVTVPRDFNLFLFGDDHEGVSARHDKGWKKLLDMMNSEYKGCKHNVGVDHGDSIEAIMVNDERYNDVYIRHDKILSQMTNAVKNREPIKDKLVCMLTGNHEMKLWRFGNITEDIAGRLGVKYGDWSSIISYRDKKGRLLFKHYCCHGGWSISSVAGPKKRKRSNMEVRLQEKLKNQMADCFLMSQGHVHKLIVNPPDESLFLYTEGSHIKSGYTNEAISQTGRYIHEDLRWYCSVGSFLKGRIIGGVTYAEMRGYDPTELGFLIAVVRDGKLTNIDQVRLL